MTELPLYSINTVLLSMSFAGALLLYMKAFVLVSELSGKGLDDVDNDFLKKFRLQLLKGLNPVKKVGVISLFHTLMLVINQALEAFEVSAISAYGALFMVASVIYYTPMYRLYRENKGIATHAIGLLKAVQSDARTACLRWLDELKEKHNIVIDNTFLCDVFHSYSAYESLEMLITHSDKANFSDDEIVHALDLLIVGTQKTPLTLMQENFNWPAPVKLKLTEMLAN